MLIIIAAQAQGTIVTRLQSSVEFTQRTLSCSGEALTLTCITNGSGINWTSVPSLDIPGNTMMDGLIYGFTHHDILSPGRNFSYLLNYTNGTAIYTSTVVEDAFNGDCNSFITFVPIPNNEDLYPTSFTNPFMITCSSGTSRAQWEYRVAGMLTQCAHLYTMPCWYCCSGYILYVHDIRPHKVDSQIIVTHPHSILKNPLLFIIYHYHVKVHKISVFQNSKCQKRLFLCSI